MAAHNTGGTAATASGASIDPALWGRACWDTMLYCAAAYPHAPSKEAKGWAKSFYTGAVHMLPCPECRDHGAAYVAAKPPTVESRDALFKWVVDYRNAVNIKVGAPQVPLVTAKAKYMKTPLAPPSPMKPPVAPLAPPSPMKPPQTPSSTPQPPTAPAATPRALAVPQARARPRFNHDAARRSMGLNNATTPAVKATPRGLVTTSRGPVVAPRGHVSAPRGPSKPRAPRKKCNCGG